MNTLAQEILKNFDDLPKTEQQAILLRRRFAIAVEILKRVINIASLAEEALEAPLKGFPPNQANLISAIETWLGEI
ncbi:hypothetical protein NG799_14065 [Laspinema sp. D1]|uniref:NACHT C-terminal Alpha/Beta domain-containing protein n=1 Tax=Laspinema palackyanum D2a TaxID=2953684 RepID=A0ABT2MVM9_9CYAN|nr:hypothetical protein [Laspinema sp. D2a]